MERSTQTATPVPAPEARAAAPIAEPLWECLDRGVQRVIADWEQLVQDAPSRDEVVHHAELILEAVRRTAQGGPTVELPGSILNRRLVELLRRAVLSEIESLPSAPVASQLVQLLQAIERVHQGIEPDWAQHFADRLSSPDGMELVVEVAHDLRSPLTSILFLAETLQRGRSGPINEVQERQLGLIYSAAFGLSSLASDVIELARGGDRLIDLEPIPFSIRDIMESVRDIVQPIAEEKGLGVRVTLPQSDFRVGHPVALSRVLLNLTTNALKFTAEGFIEVIGTQTSGTGIEFMVRDTGHGIPTQAMLMLFEPFRRRQREGDYAFSGSGLGLSICRKLVEAMGSELKVETAEDAGTRFFFEIDLPLAR